MIRRFQIPLGLLFSYSVFSQWIWGSHSSTSLIKHLILNSSNIAFISALSNPGGTSINSATLNEALTLFNIYAVFLSLAVGFISAQIVIEILSIVFELMLALPDMLTNAVEKVAEVVSKNSANFKVRALSNRDKSIFSAVLTMLLLILFIKAIFWVLGMIGSPYTGQYESLGAQLLYYWDLLDGLLLQLLNAAH